MITSARSPALGRTGLFRTDLVLSGSYWWYFAAVGCFGPYLVLYYRTLGLSGLQIGILAALLPLGIAVLAPVWGALADRYCAHRLVLRSALLLSGLSTLLLSQMTAFPSILVTVVFWSFSVAPVVTLLDSYGITVSEKQGIAYGRLRVWGTFGFITASWGVGQLMGGTVSNLFLYGYSALLLLALVATLGLPPLDSGTAQPMFRSIRGIVACRPVMVLLITAYLVTVGSTMMYGYFGIYVDELGGDAGFLGTAHAVAAASEIPVLFFGAWLLSRVGLRRTLALAVAIYVVRLLVYGFLPEVEWAFAAQLLHGLSFGAYLMASVTLVHRLAGRALAATAQGVLSATSFGFGAITGALLGGALLDHIGVIGIYRVAAVILGAALLVFVIGVYGSPRAAEPEG